MIGLLKRLADMFEPVLPAPLAPTNATWTPETVEQRIELAGRAEVFAEARRLGWEHGSMPPMWVWGAIANDIIARKPDETRTLH